ncbi:MAG TPA: deaminase [Candidatus Paceibacterota bacterium]|nr:deaminase [Candidatus Paceibacterota bacterium]
MENQKCKCLIMYMPVLHQGYLNLFREKDFDVVFVLGEDVISFLERKEFESLSRDLRRLHSETIAQFLKSVFSGVQLLPLELLKNQLFFINYEVHLTGDNIGRFIAEKFFSDREDIIFENVFLRWHKQISEKENEVRPDRTISTDERDRMFMDQAFKEGEKSSDWWRRVGAVLVVMNKVALVSHNRHMPHEYIQEMDGNSRIDHKPGERIDLVTSIHAEASLVGKSSRQGVITEGADLYVTTFPCPGCARIIVEAGISKVFYKDGYSLFDGEEILRSGNVEIILVK